MGRPFTILRRDGRDDPRRAAPVGGGAVALIAVALIVVALTGCDRGTGSTIGAAPGTAPRSAGVDANAFVEYIVDGDTIDVVVDGREERVRLIGIDTPEVERGDAPGECFGPEATTYMQQLLPIGTPVRVERDIVGRDDYGRLLGYVFRASDGIFVNYEMMRQGYAQPLSIAPNDTHAELFTDAARAAERDDTGLWATCSR